MMIKILECTEYSAGSCLRCGMILELRAERDAARAEADAWKETAETEAWPFEWEVASRLKDERDAAIAEADALREELAALRTALLSLVDSKSEFDIEYDTGMDAGEARRIMDLAYDRQ